MALESAALVGGTAAIVLETVWSTGTAVAGLAPVKDWAAGLHARAAGRLALPVNHTLVRTIRTAHLTAIDKITRRHADLLLDLPKKAGNGDEAAFNETIRLFLSTRLKLLRDTTDFAAVTEAEVQHVLDEMVHPSTIEGYAEAAAENRRHAEARALAELESHAGFPAPPLYRRLFIGEAEPGWYETFGLFVNEQIKSNEAFRSIFLAAELVDLKRLIAGMDDRIAAALMRGVHRMRELEGKIDSVKVDTAATRDEVGVIRALLEQVLATLRANESERAALLEQIESLRAQQDLSAETIAGFLRDIGAKDVAPADYPATMATMAERFRALLAEAERRTNLPAALEEARLRAADAIRQGDLDAADGLLRRIELRLAEQRREQQAAYEQSCRDEAAVKGERAALARTRLRYQSAAQLYQEASELVSFDTEESWRWLMAGGDALEADGREFGENSILKKALDLYKTALIMVPREKNPPRWAKVQRKMGQALRIIGNRESANTSLEAALRAYDLSLEEISRDISPLEWATIQNHRGTALAALGSRESGSKRLEEAIAAYELALEERTFERAPRAWADTQNNLGAALGRLGGRENGIDRLRRAVEAYRSAMRVRTREDRPLAWARTQHNVGSALVKIGQRESGSDSLIEAVTTYRLALEVRTRDRLPLSWAETQSDLGLALTILGERSNDVSMLQAAVAAYRLALEERTQLRAPLYWAATQDNLGIALRALGKLESGTARLWEAVAAHRLALEERRRDRVPFLWAQTMKGIAFAEEILGERQDARQHWQSALENIMGALMEYDKAEASFYVGAATAFRDRLAARLAALP